MTKCLITRLNGVVDNNSLKKKNEFRIGVEKITSPNSNTQGFSVQFSKETTLSIIGDGYFTDENLSANKGKSLIVPAQDGYNVTTIYLSNGTYEVSIPDKFALTRLYSHPKYDGISDKSHCSLDIDELKYVNNMLGLSLSNIKATGDISSLSNKVKMDTLRLNNVDVYGNIDSLSNLTEMRKLQSYYTKISGNISSISKLKLLSEAYFQLENIVGDISALSSMSNLTLINMFNISGDISSLNSLNALRQIQLNKGSLTGDLAKVPAKVYFLALNNNSNNGFTWSSRDASSSIFAIAGNPLVLNLDKMLQDLANCTKQTDAPSASNYKAIFVKGAKTSASDSAVQTLQNKGYTVSITPA